MNIKTINGKLFIENKEVSLCVFEDGTTLKFPLDNSKITLTDNSTVEVKGNKNNIISGKNIMSNCTIKTEGSFRLGDD